MENTEFERILKLLEQASPILEKLPPEVRSSAFSVLQPFISSQTATPQRKSTSTAEKVETPKVDAADAEAFFSAHNHEKPADNVKLITAYLYNKYGSEPFSTDEVRTLADEVGITIPARPDATLNAALTDGKKLFNRAGKSKWRPTVHGEAYLKTTYSVIKGNKKREAPAE